LAGLTCSSFLCRPFCPAADVGGECPGSNTPCIQFYNDEDVAIDQDSVCFSTCTPSPNNCPVGACTIEVTGPGSSAIYAYCQEPGTDVAGDSCASSLDCAAGTFCGVTSGECEQICRTTSDCANLGVEFACNTSIGFTLGGVVYGICVD
jgi:hypothetical protein